MYFGSRFLFNGNIMVFKKISGEEYFLFVNEFVLFFKSPTKY